MAKTKTTDSKLLEIFDGKMKSGLSSTDAYNQMLGEFGGEPSGPFGGPRRQGLHDLIHRTAQGKKIIRKYEKPGTWDVHSLDVWGNAEDGFEVNNEFKAGTVELPSLADDAEVLKIFKEAGLIDSHIRLSQVEFDDQSTEGFFAVVQKKDGMPVYHVYKTRD